MKFRLIVTVLLAITTLKGFSQTVLNICYFKNAKGLELLATKELQRYIYLRTGRLPLLKSIAQNDNLPANSILVSSKANASHSLVYKTINLDSLVNNDAFQLKSLKGNRLVITGSTSVATLYGAYKFLQSTGIGFELDDDIIPDAILKSITLTGFNKVFTPSFELRGIQPFHDFPEGPDWWNADDYKAIITQLPKMGMNFIGFHTYPEKNPFGGWEKAEPVSWIGTKDQLNNDGTVKSAYPALHQNTQDSTWDYLPKKTSDFNFGASQIFESDNYGADYMKGISRWPHTDHENIDIFNNMGQALNQAFSMAKSLGVKTCIGTETPLTIPGKVKAHLKSQNKDWQANDVKQELYEGIFTRIKAIHQLDYYWLWTPESWTWEGEKPEAVDQTKMDLTSALAAAKKINTPFTLATCGWVLGPSRDRTEFDRLLPKDMPFAVINRQTGFAPVEPSFKNITNRPKWQISWMEDDPAITAPQFWAGRTLKDAQDAYRYGCTGFMGIHWRTKILSPSFTALAKAGWEAADYKIKLDSLHRDYPAADLYNDWARLQFGEQAAAKTAAIFIRLDGGPQSEKDKDNRKTNFPRPVEWGEKGGGRINLNFLPWSEVEKQYAFINDFENCALLVTGANNKERYNYWLNNFYYTKNLGHIGCVLGQMDQLAKKITTETGADARKAMASQLLKLRSEAALLWKDLATRLLQTINTTGEMGTIANLEQHNLQSLKLLNKQDSILKVVLGNVPPLNLSGLYAGKPRLIVATKRTLLNNGEDFNMRVRILSAGNIQQPVFYWRPLGSKTFKPLNLKHEARNVYRVNLDHQNFKSQGFEYYITTTASSENLRYPAGDQNKTVVIW